MESIGTILSRELEKAKKARDARVPADVNVEIRGRYFVVRYPWYRGQLSTFHLTAIFNVFDYPYTPEGINAAIEETRKRAEREAVKNGIR